MAVASRRGVGFEKAIVKVDAEMNYLMLRGFRVENPVKGVRSSSLSVLR